MKAICGNNILWVIVIMSNLLVICFKNCSIIRIKQLPSFTIIQIFDMAKLSYVSLRVTATIP